MTSPATDLNDVITSAVKARVEASVLEALSGDAFFGQMVSAALNRTVEVTDPENTYRKIRVPFVTNLIEATMQQAVKAAAQRLVAEQADEIEEAVRKELRRSSTAIAQQLVGSVTRAAESPYGIKVELQYPSR